MVLGAHAVLCKTEPDFFKIIFWSQNGENRPSLGFFECIDSQFFNFFSIWTIIKAYITAIAVCLKKISYLRKFWFLRYDPKCSWPIRLRDFSINCRTLKLAVISQRKIFLIFGTMVNNSNIEKLTGPFFQENSFLPKFGQKGPRMTPK